MARSSDIDIAIWAQDAHSVEVTMDIAFSKAQMSHGFGRLIWLRCTEPEAAEVLASKLDEVLRILRHREHVVIKVSRDQVTALGGGWE
jgi:hypothetical protein